MFELGRVTYGRKLFQGTDTVTGFTVDGGTLTPLAAAPGPLGAKPSGIVVN